MVIITPEICSILGQISEAIKCPVCFRGKNIGVLTCSHNMCISCYGQLPVKKCPLCRAENVTICKDQAINDINDIIAEYIKFDLNHLLSLDNANGIEYISSFDTINMDNNLFKWLSRDNTNDEYYDLILERLDFPLIVFKFAQRNLHILINNYNITNFIRDIEMLDDSNYAYDYTNIKNNVIHLWANNLIVCNIYLFINSLPIIKMIYMAKDFDYNFVITNTANIKVKTFLQEKFPSYRLYNKCNMLDKYSKFLSKQLID